MIPGSAKAMIQTDESESPQTKGETRMKFDFCIGNPPYQEDFTSDGNKTYAAPVYNVFMDAAIEVSDRVELIHPARFLFNAGSTPKSWNQKMLNDPHFKVIDYQEDATCFFPQTEIKGGVAVTYHDETRDFGPIKVFLKSGIMNGILSKILGNNAFVGMDTIVVSRTVYRLTEKMHNDHPEARYCEDKHGNNIGLLSKGHDYDMATNIFSVLPQIFHKSCPEDGHEYIRILGRRDNERLMMWIRKDYVNTHKPLYKHSIVLPKANNTGRFGETLSQPVQTEPGVGTTETFLSIGFFDTKVEDDNCLKYISTKFARAMLGILKTTQDLTPDKFAYVPLQNFTADSDIDWNKSIPEIDRQLYRKYGLTQEEIDFIETHVKEMT